MLDDVLVNKTAVIERRVARARQEYAADPGTFDSNFTRQDAAILNVQRACEAALDIRSTPGAPRALGRTPECTRCF